MKLILAKFDSDYMFPMKKQQNILCTSWIGIEGIQCVERWESANSERVGDPVGLAASVATQ